MRPRVDEQRRRTLALWRPCLEIRPQVEVKESSRCRWSSLSDLVERSGEAGGSHLLVMSARWWETTRPQRANTVRLPRASDTDGDPRRADLRPVARGDLLRHGWLEIVVAAAT